MKVPSSSFCHSSEVGRQGSLPEGGCQCPRPADGGAFACILRSKADASSHSFLGQNSFQHRFLSNIWWVQRNHESFYKLSFAFQSLLNQHRSKPTICHASQSHRWQSCHVMSDLMENGKGETLPRTVAVLERVVDLEAKISAYPLTLISQSLALLYSGQQLLFYSQVTWKIGQGHFWKIWNLQYK